jgi:selenocysteine lyase/cysteine desulfurase
VSFNLLGLDHELLARILNDYFNIAVRNQCFCAHPYVRELILKELWDLDPDLTVEEIEAKKGMVRVSLALYNTVQDVDLLLNAIRKIGQESADFIRNYILQEDGSYKNVNFVSESRFDIEQVLDECF